MSIWDTYPASYRSHEISQILAAVESGECAALIGLSGSGKSNLMGFLANRITSGPPRVLVDCNRLAALTIDAFQHLLVSTLDPEIQERPDPATLNRLLKQYLEHPPGNLCLLIDRFEALEPIQAILGQNLRSLRDDFKYQLTMAIAARRSPDPTSELAELFFANSVWLGPLTETDARWSIQQFARRKGQIWEADQVEQLIAISWGYPSFLRAACEAYAQNTLLQMPQILEHPAVSRRLAEFWEDNPSPEQLQASGLAGHPWLKATAPLSIPQGELTAKEQALLDYLRQHADEVCDKQDLIEAVWPEDVVFEEGLRDESLAQLVRRLRVKIEAEPSRPQHLLTIPGRGYSYTP
jgi:energy-coupling factor transporter ATP-binding protein EcfA2